MKNPAPGISTSVRYSEQKSLPLLEGEVNSRGVPLAEFRVPPSQALDLAETLLSHAGWIVRDIVDRGNEINSREIDRLQEQLEAIEERYAETSDYVATAAERASAPEDSDTVETPGDHPPDADEGDSVEPGDGFYYFS